MSLIKKLKKVGKAVKGAVKSVVKPIAKQAIVAAAQQYGGPVGGQIASAAVYGNPVNARVQWTDPFSASNPINPMGIGSVGTFNRTPMGPSLRSGKNMSVIRGVGSLPGAGYAAGRAVAQVGRMVGGRAGLVAAGLSVIGGLIYDQSGQVVGKAPKRRAKGITGAQLKAFYRVNSLLNKVCKTAPPISRRGASRGGKRACR